MHYYLVIVMDSYGSQLVTEHRALVRALRSGNADRARAKAREHLQKTIQRSTKVDLRTVNASIEHTLDTHYSDFLFESTRPGQDMPKRTISKRNRSPIAVM